MRKENIQMHFFFLVIVFKMRTESYFSAMNHYLHDMTMCWPVVRKNCLKCYKKNCFMFVQLIYMNRETLWTDSTFCRNVNELLLLAVLGCSVFSFSKYRQRGEDRRGEERTGEGRRGEEAVAGRPAGNE